MAEYVCSVCKKRFPTDTGLTDHGRQMLFCSVTCAMAQWMSEMMKNAMSQ